MRLREALAWCIGVIDHEVKPPESCGGCGTPNANCDGECADAFYFSKHMRAARALASPPAPKPAADPKPWPRCPHGLLERVEGCRECNAEDETRQRQEGLRVCAMLGQHLPNADGKCVRCGAG